MSTREAAELMSEHQIRRLPVVEGERLVGIVSLGDIAVKEGKDPRVGDTLQSISEGVKERILADSGSPSSPPPSGHARTSASTMRITTRRSAAATAVDARTASFSRWFDARLGRRVAASVADQRLVGDLGSTVAQIMADGDYCSYE